MPSHDRDLPLANLLRSAAQGLTDLAVTGASSVVFVREARGLVSPFYEGLESVAGDAGFVVAETSLTDAVGFDALASLVKTIASSLRVVDAKDRGLVALLDAFARTHGRGALEAFEEAALREGLSGDVAALARAYLGAKRGDSAEARKIRAFLDGRDVNVHDVSGALVDRNAKRVLASLTRLVRALGHAGTLVVVRRAADVTELSPARREAAYTVIRELADNADGPRGAVALRLYVSGAEDLFDGSRALTENTPLTLRVAHGALTDPAASLLPHATLVDLASLPAAEVADPEEPPARRAKALGTIVRLSLGLPPLGDQRELTVGYERIDEALDKLFAHAENQGSVFSLLAGDYGSGKTHLLMHLTTRALADRRPVLRLAVERMDADLGNPQRHLRRLLEGALLPGAHAPSPEDRLEAWTRTHAATRKLARALEEVAETDAACATAAKRALRALGEEEDDLRALHACLLGHDLEEKPGNPGYRQDAYARLLLWLELLTRLDGFSGPVVIIDEAENLYRSGTSKPERRTALRSLGFYCGGSLPNACVILAVTPETLDLLRSEADAMLDDITEQRTVLASEDVTMLRHRLTRSRPLEVARLGRAELVELAERLRAVHASARGAVRDKGWAAWVDGAAAKATTPRQLVRAAVTRLERAFWVREG